MMAKRHSQGTDELEDTSENELQAEEDLDEGALDTVADEDWVVQGLLRLDVVQGGGDTLRMDLEQTFHAINKFRILTV